MDTLLGLTSAERWNVILQLCGEWDEEHPEQPARKSIRGDASP
jgi:hypothetical protein